MRSRSTVLALLAAGVLGSTDTAVPQDPSPPQGLTIEALLKAHDEDQVGSYPERSARHRPAFEASF